MPFAHLPFARPKAEPHFLWFPPTDPSAVLGPTMSAVVFTLLSPHLSNPNVLLTGWDQVKRMMDEKDVYLGGTYVESAKNGSWRVESGWT